MANATDDCLRLLVERIERLEKERAGIADDIRDTYMNALGMGGTPLGDYAAKQAKAA